MSSTGEPVKLDSSPQTPRTPRHPAFDQRGDANRNYGSLGPFCRRNDGNRDSGVENHHREQDQKNPAITFAPLFAPTPASPSLHLNSLSTFAIHLFPFPPLLRLYSSSLISHRWLLSRFPRYHRTLPSLFEYIQFFRTRSTSDII